MSAHELARGLTDEHYTPWYIFEALGVRFDLDVASPAGVETCVPADRFLTCDALAQDWGGAFVWCNLPFGHERAKEAWLRRFFDHGHGIALTPDRTSAPWHQEAVRRADLHLNVASKVKFYTPDAASGGLRRGEGPGCGTTLWAAGAFAAEALIRAASRGLGSVHATLRISIVEPRVVQPPKGALTWDGEVAASRHAGPGLLRRGGLDA